MEKHHGTYDFGFWYVSCADKQMGGVDCMSNDVFLCKESQWLHLS